MTATKLRVRSAICSVALVVLVAACERAPAGITCDKLRSLRLGMTGEQVRTILGEPPRTYPLVSPAEASTPLIWDYGDPSGVRLQVEFVHDRLTSVSSWVRTLWRDMVEDGPRPSVFLLNANHDGPSHIEGAQFVSLYCPNGR